MGWDAPRDGHIHARKTGLKTWPGAPSGAEVGRMLFIAFGIALALVAADLLDLTKVRR